MPTLGLGQGPFPAVLIGPKLLEFDVESLYLHLELVSVVNQGFKLLSPRPSGLEFRLACGVLLPRLSKMLLKPICLGPGGNKLFPQRADLVGLSLERLVLGPDRLDLGAEALHLLVEPIPVGAGCLEVPTQLCVGLEVGLTCSRQSLRFTKFRPEPIGIEPSGVEFLTRQGGVVSLLLQTPGPVANSSLLVPKCVEFVVKGLNHFLEPVPVGA
ncbi:hypothetical protein EP7_002017 [Isosphaeraceae bacterium EP7]